MSLQSFLKPYDRQLHRVLRLFVKHTVPHLTDDLCFSAILAQAGIWILTALVWASVLENNFIFFSYHPLLNSAAVLLFVQGTLVLQPTAAQKDKVNGTYVHSILNTLGVAGKKTQAPRRQSIASFEMEQQDLTSSSLSQHSSRVWSSSN